MIHVYITVYAGICMILQGQCFGTVPVYNADVGFSAGLVFLNRRKVSPRRFRSYCEAFKIVYKFCCGKRVNREYQAA